MKDYYQVLKVSRSATTDQIKAAYRSLALSLHPDVTRGDKAKEVLFKEVAEAFETLSNSALRRSYDIMYYRGDYSNHSRSSGQSFYRQQSSNTAYKPQARPVRTVSPTQFNVELWNSWHYGDDSVSKVILFTPLIHDLSYMLHFYRLMFQK